MHKQLSILVAAIVFVFALKGTFIDGKNGGNLNKAETSQTAALTDNDARKDSSKFTYCKPSKSKSGRPHSVRIQGDRRGHFLVQARMNGKRIRAMVDTGASAVAINESTARKLGLRVKSKDFKGTSSTANGVVSFAPVKIKEIRIGVISVCNVRAAVLRDRSLDGTLLGMSFLKKLRGFEVRGNVLTMKK